METNVERPMPRCPACNDTGVIETGNNDIPCECPAGDKAMFNVAGEGEVRGEVLKRRNRVTRFPTKEGDRTDYGHRFQWLGESWFSTSGQKVEVIPPKTLDDRWWIVLHDQPTVEPMDFRGEDAEGRAFCVAEGYTRQKLRS